MNLRGICQIENYYLMDFIISITVIDLLLLGDDDAL